MRLILVLIVLICLGSLSVAESEKDSRELDVLAKFDAPGVSRVISVKETNMLKAIRDEIGEIKDLDQLYEDRTHETSLPYHVYVPKNLKSNVKYPLVTFLHGFTDLTIDTHKGFPKGVWSLPKIQKANPHILFCLLYTSDAADE